MLKREYYSPENPSAWQSYVKDMDCPSGQDYKINIKNPPGGFLGDIGSSELQVSSYPLYKDPAVERIKMALIKENQVCFSSLNNSRIEVF